MLGAGYALPFFLAGIYPAALKKILPRPGRWMEVVKKLFALPMLATCGWLLWVLWSGAETVPSAWEPYRPEKVEAALEKARRFCSILPPMVHHLFSQRKVGVFGAGFCPPGQKA